jgi:hypothetical protein
MKRVCFADLIFIVALSQFDWVIYSIMRLKRLLWKFLLMNDNIARAFLMGFIFSAVVVMFLILCVIIAKPLLDLCARFV